MSTDKRCRATNRGGQPCGQPPVPGALVCHYHGGAAGQVKRKAAVRVAEAKAATLVDVLGAGPVSDPLTALLEVAGEVVAFKVYLSERAGELASSADSDEERATLGAYERALDRCGRILVDMAKLNLDERTTRLAEGQAQMLGAVVLRVLASTDLGVVAGGSKGTAGVIVLEGQQAWDSDMPGVAVTGILIAVQGTDEAARERAIRAALRAAADDLVGEVEGELARQAQTPKGEE